MALDKLIGGVGPAGAPHVQHARGAGRGAGGGAHPCSRCSLRAAQGVGAWGGGAGRHPCSGERTAGSRGHGTEASRAVGDTGPWVKARGLPFGDLLSLISHCIQGVPQETETTPVIGTRKIDVGNN